MIKRNLDGVYFRVERDGKWESICFSDLTKDEREKVMENRSEEWLKNMCQIMSESLRKVGDELDIVAADDDEE